MTSLRELAELVPCRKCGAAPTFSCITDGSRGGRRRSTTPHAVRERPIYDAWRDGFGEGMAEAIVGVANRNGRRSGDRISPAQLERLLMEFVTSWSLDIELEDLRR